MKPIVSDNKALELVYKMIRSFKEVGYSKWTVKKQGVGLNNEKLRRAATQATQIPNLQELLGAVRSLQSAGSPHLRHTHAHC